MRKSSQVIVSVAAAMGMAARAQGPDLCGPASFNAGVFLQSRSPPSRLLLGGSGAHELFAEVPELITIPISPTRAWEADWWFPPRLKNCGHPTAHFTL